MRLASVLLLLAAVLPLRAFEVTFWIDHSAYATVTDAAGQTVSLHDGTNSLDLAGNQTPLTVGPSQAGTPTEIFFDGHTIMNITAPVELPVADGMTVKVWTRAVTNEITVTFNCTDPSMATARCGGTLLDLEGFNKLPRNSVVQIEAQPGCRVHGVTASPSPATPPVEEAGVWSVTADRNMTVNIDVVADREENVMINIDSPVNARVTTAAGEVVALAPGANYMQLDPATDSPLTVAPAPGGAVVMVAAQGEMLFAGSGGTYTVPLEADGSLTQIYIVTERTQANIFTVNIDRSQAVSLAWADGTPLPLSDGANEIYCDFDNGNLLHLSANGDNVLRAVAVDGVGQPIEGNTCDFAVYRASVVDIATATAGETGWVTIADEDFNAFTGGTADNPDTSAPLLNMFGDFNDPSLLQPYHSSCTRGWGGDKVYAAGGALAVMNGFLNTPVGDYSGQLRMTFRARLVPGYPQSSRGLEVLLIRDKVLVEYKRHTVTLTDDWQTYTFTASNGWYNDTRIQFFCMDDCWFEVDDVRIDHRSLSIEPPRPLDAADIANDGFTAVWEPTETADGYLLNVYEHGTPEGGYTLDEDFENLTADNEGRLETWPEGWEGNLEAGGARQLNDNALYASSGTKSICFDADKDYIVTPAGDCPLTALSYTLAVDRAGRQDAGSSTSLLSVNVLTDDGWCPWLSHSVAYVATAGTSRVDATPHLGMYGHIYAVRFEAVMEAGETMAVMLDDVHMEAEGNPRRLYLWQDREIEGNTTVWQRVEGEGFDTEADYWYSVKARRGSQVSDEAGETEVFCAHTPVALAAQAVTADSFEARWECGRKADLFDISLVNIYEAKADGAATLLHEDFGLAASNATPSNPDNLGLTQGAVALDGLTRLDGWRATSPALASGAIGGMAANEGSAAGSVITPRMDLSHDNGRVTVRVRAWLEGGDALQIQASGPTSYDVALWQQTGWQEVTFHLENCRDNDDLTLWSGVGNPFMLDDIEVSQNLHAGDRVAIHTKTVTAEGGDTRSAAVDGISRWGDYTYAYEVTAWRRHPSRTGDMACSDTSNRVAVPLTAPDAVPALPGSRESVSAADGTIRLDLAAPAIVSLYTADGRLADTWSAPSGQSARPCAAGIYVLHLRGGALKIVL